MLVKTGDMWSCLEASDLFCVTTNATINHKGHLVMGRGIAKQARDMFPTLAGNWGERISGMGKAGNFYGLLLPQNPASKLCAFQTKYHWQQPADTMLILGSAAKLLAWMLEHPKAQVNLNFPGIGNGRLTEDQVLPIFKHFSDRLTLWKLD